MGLTNAIRRASGAIDRHGLPGLAAITCRAVVRLGLGKSLRLAAGDQPFLSEVSAPSTGAGGTERRWPPRLDREGTVSAAAWARWLGRPAADGFGASSPAIAFVISPATGPADGVNLTRQAIQAIGANLPVIESGDWAPEAATTYVFLQPGDAPRPEFPRALSQAVGDGAAQIITFDLFRRRGERVQPVLLPGANPPLLAETDYIFSRAAVKGAALLDAQGAAPREAILAWCAGRSVAETRAGWRHIARPLLEIAAVEERPAGPIRPPKPRPARRAAKGKAGPVSAVICTRDKGHLTRQLVRQLLALGKDQVSEVVILSNGTTNPHALQTLSDLARDARVQVVRDDAPFNFSRLCNAGVRQTRGRGPLLFLNDDIAPVSEDWLGALAHQLMAGGVGAVGPLLLYPNERVQHAGIYLRFPAGVGHVLRGAVLPQDDPLGLAASAREVSALTGAALLTDRSAFEQVSGFDEQLALSFQDVDYGLKLHQAGLRNLFEPRSILIHMESVSLDKAGTDRLLLLQRYREKALFMARWRPVFAADPFYPAELDPDDESGRRLRLR